MESRLLLPKDITVLEADSKLIDWVSLHGDKLSHKFLSPRGNFKSAKSELNDFCFHSFRAFLRTRAGLGGSSTESAETIFRGFIRGFLRVIVRVRWTPTSLPAASAL